MADATTMAQPSAATASEHAATAGELAAEQPSAEGPLFGSREELSQR